MALQQYTDPHGLSFTASSVESAETFAQLTSSYMGFRRETGDLLKALNQADPEMPMAQCAKGYFAKLMGSASHSHRGIKISADLNQYLLKVDANPREQQHAAALSAWCEGKLERATQIWESILLDYPLDGLALRLAHFTHFYSGDGRQMRDSIARVLPLWSENHTDYGFLLGMYAFGHEESGDYVMAEKYGRMAVERNPCDSWSVHSVAHVLEMTERHQEGIEWVDSLEKDWSTVNNFRFHLYWHKCLYHLERGEFERVLAIYDEQIVSDIESEFYLDICNASSLLWRLEMFGIDIGDRWGKLMEVSRGHIEDQDLIFVSLHYLMALIAGGDEQATGQMIDNIQSWSTLDGTQAEICANVGVALAEGLQLARDKRHTEAYEKILAVRYRMDQIGGSKAQRDVFHMIMLNALIASNDALQAQRLFAERVEQKRRSSWTWKHYGNILQKVGNETGAKQAMGNVAAILV